MSTKLEVIKRLQNFREPRGDYKNNFPRSGRAKDNFIWILFYFFLFSFERKSYYVVQSTGIETWLKVFSSRFSISNMIDRSGEIVRAPVDVYKTCWYSSLATVCALHDPPEHKSCCCVRREACWIFEFSLIYYILQSVAKEKESSAGGVGFCFSINQSVSLTVVAASFKVDFKDFFIVLTSELRRMNRRLLFINSLLVQHNEMPKL